MKNNFGFGKFEVLTVIVLLMIVFGILAYNLLGGVSSKKFDTMQEQAIKFGNTVTTNLNTFHNTEHVYLGEVVDEKLLSGIKNPFGVGYCSISESNVYVESGLPIVTLRCGSYLIDSVRFSGEKNADIYEVSDWNEKKSKDENVEEKVLYNCKDNGKMKFEEYYDELYFVYLINKDYNSSYYFANQIKEECEVVSKTFYRTKTLVEK